MSRNPSRTPPPDLDAEQEIDLARYWRAVAARWWLPLLGLLAGMVIGYALSYGGKDVWRARALVYLGTPLTPSGAQVPSLNTSPNTVREILRSDEAIESTARDVGLDSAKLRAGVSSQQLRGTTARVGQVPLFAVIVKGEPRGKITAATNELAEHVVERVSGYADTKIETLGEQVASDERELARIDDRIQRFEDAIASASPSERLSALALVGFAEQRRSVIQEDLRTARQLLALAEEVERARVIERGVARKTTARSPRNSLLAGGVLGLLLGTIAALLWQPLTRLRS